ncbi:Polyketide cyclase / dehydrase and lipid transport [Nakamurella panacisegetis]|uniref:Polyketide cyclase / dehydrase and lipid transport n=1 Tax=Nakamurella panacisegetis TaxID=1090615 RepID=A0A1H0QKU0_9ACTN|nr:SRPBCC family protein [Nakamurella panacisegetis]SDP17800.1 Polyketide cyclase / dehydrase and lipid transport [Nakamurella panacisegetis]
MEKISRDCSASPQDVFEVLADGWLYASWVVGAARIRAVDAAWPLTGSRIHHSIGPWPLLLDDETVVRQYDPPRLVVLQAKGWPVGEAEVRIEATARPGGCTVTIAEDVIAGPGKFIPKPLRQLMIGWRNTETLRRLVLMAEGRAVAARPT